jgi:hypothetical protein
MALSQVSITEKIDRLNPVGKTGGNRTAVKSVFAVQRNRALDIHGSTLVLRHLALLWVPSISLIRLRHMTAMPYSGTGWEWPDAGPIHAFR